MAEERKVMPIRLALSDLARLDKQRGGMSRQAWVEGVILDALGGPRRVDRTKAPAKTKPALRDVGIDRADAFRRMKPSSGIIGGAGKTERKKR